MLQQSFDVKAMSCSILLLLARMSGTTDHLGRAMLSMHERLLPEKFTAMFDRLGDVLFLHKPNHTV